VSNQNDTFFRLTMSLHPDTLGSLFQPQKGTSMSEKLQAYSARELFALEDKVRQAMLGSDDETRRYLTNFMTYIDAEKDRRKSGTSTTESTQ
jgi:hypothetical protein